MKGTNLEDTSVIHARKCCQFVNKGLAAASYILLFVLLLAFGSRDGQDVPIYGYMFIDFFILVYRLCNRIFSVPITKGSDD
jgi:hypothetical protein